jgi:nucleotide-binding universal stress UspA family protein
MTSPLLEWTYPKKLIKLNDITPEAVEEIDETIAPYRIIVPIANPTTQKGLMQLAVAIAGSRLQPAIVHPLSLIEIEENYAFDSTPGEADRLIQQRRVDMQRLIQSLELSPTRQIISPIIRTTNNVARETAQIATLEQANLVVMGWHRPAFSSNRLGGRVGQILSTGRVDVAVFIDKGEERLESLLVPYSASIHDELGLEIALRLLINSDQRRLTILRVAHGEQTQSEFDQEYSSIIEQLPTAVRDRMNLRVIEAPDPIHAVVEASASVDLTIAGTSSAWGIQRQTLGRYTDELAIQCRSSLVITRRYSQVTSNLASVISNVSVDRTTDEFGVGV